MIKQYRNINYKVDQLTRDGKIYTLYSCSDKQLLKEYTTNPSTLRWLNRADWSTMEQPDFLEFLKKKGYDSFTTSEGGVKNVGIFNPKNICFTIISICYSSINCRICYK